MLFHPPSPQKKLILSQRTAYEFIAKRTQPEPNPNLKFFTFTEPEPNPNLGFLKLTEPNRTRTYKQVRTRLYIHTEQISDN